MTSLTVPPGLASQTHDRPGAKQKVPKNRVQFDPAPKSIERLHVLKAKIEAASYAEVVKNAWRLYEALIGEIENRGQFFVRDDRGALTPYHRFL